MKKNKIEFLSPAIQDIKNIASYHLRMVGAKSAKAVTDNLLESILILEDQPLIGSLHPDTFLKKQGYRKIVCNDYICIYKIIDNKIFIYRVVHGSTNYPNSFK